MEQVWECKIGGQVGALPSGADGSMRDAVREAYRKITGAEPEFTFSGWGGSLTEPERAVVEDREPFHPFRNDGGGCCLTCEQTHDAPAHVRR